MGCKNLIYLPPDDYFVLHPHKLNHVPVDSSDPCYHYWCHLHLYIVNITIFILVLKLISVNCTGTPPEKPKDSLNMPVELLESNEGIVYPCAYCNLQYGSATQLRRHNYNVHSKGEMACKLCDFKASTKPQLYSHRERCETFNTFKCDTNFVKCKSIYI